MAQRLTVVQMLPALESGGVEKGTLEVGKYLVGHGHRSIVISAGGRMVARLGRAGCGEVDGPYTPGRFSSVMVRGERVIAISDMIREYILKNSPWVDPASIRVIPRGVDPQAYPHGYQPPAGGLAQRPAAHPTPPRQRV